MTDLTTPDDLALLYVQQWLSERGYTQALKSLEAECGILYDEDKVCEGSKLLQLVWKEVEESLSSDRAVDPVRLAEEEAFLRGGQNDFAVHTSAVVTNPRGSACICVAFDSGTDNEAVIVGSGDATVSMIGFAEKVCWSTTVGSGGVLSLALNPCSRSWNEPQLLAAGSMDGSVALLDASNGNILASSQPHRKYVIRVTWTNCVPEVKRLASASHDHSVVVQQLIQDASTGAWRLESIKQIQYASSVQDITALSNPERLLVAVRDSAHLRLVNLGDSLEHGEVDEQLINMNERGDDHVSFSARHLALSMCSKYLAVSCDGGRVLLLRTSDWSVLRCLHGVPQESFHNHWALWHRDCQYLYCAAAGAQVYVFHVGTGKVVYKCTGHKQNVRNAAYDPSSNMLVTCSYDKTFRVLKAL